LKLEVWSNKGRREMDGGGKGTCSEIGIHPN